MINSSYLKKCQQNKEFMAFTILVIISGVADKSGKELDAENFVILKNRAVSAHNITYHRYFLQISMLMLHDISGNG